MDEDGFPYPDTCHRCNDAPCTEGGVLCDECRYVVYDDSVVDITTELAVA